MSRDRPELPPLYPLANLLEAWEADATAAHEAYVHGIPRGPITGLPTLDQQLGGALSPGFHILHGQPGAGKSALALQIAAKCRCPALLVSCEMGALELLRRVTARVTSTFLGRLKTGELRPEDSVGLARKAAAACPHLTIMDATRNPAPVEHLRDVAFVLRGDARNLLVVVDSLHSWADGGAGDIPEYEGLNAALGALRSLAAVLECPLLVVAERNRASMKSSGQSAGAGTRKIEYGAETVISLDRDPEAREDARGEVPVTLSLPKNRNGAAGRKIDLRFHTALQRFEE